MVEEGHTIVQCKYGKIFLHTLPNCDGITLTYGKLRKLKRDIIQADSTEKTEVTLTVPLVPPSTLRPAEAVKIAYHIEVEVRLEYPDVCPLWLRLRNPRTHRASAAL